MENVQDGVAVKSDRLLSVLLLLQAKGRVTERELAERLEVSQRTIHRDLEALSAARVPIVALRGSQGGWELDKGWRTQVPGLDESELRALLMAQPRVVGNPRLAAAAESALNKLMAALPGPDARTRRRHARAPARRSHRLVGEPAKTCPCCPIVQDAVSRQRQLAFDYVRGDGQRSARTVDPSGDGGKRDHLVFGGPRRQRAENLPRLAHERQPLSWPEDSSGPPNSIWPAYWAHTTAELEGRRKPFSVVLALSPGRGADAGPPAAPRPR